MTLRVLLLAQANHREVRHLVTEIYGWFSEGFDTPDLHDANALLEELSSSARG